MAPHCVAGARNASVCAHEPSITDPAAVPGNDVPRPASMGGGRPPRPHPLHRDPREIEGLTVETVRLPGRTPVILMEVPGTSPETILLYGHCDKQPEMTGWAEGLGPWIPVRRGDRLYGRGAQDDGYAAFCALTAIEAVQEAGAPHARLVVLIEASEESGS